MIQYSLKCAQDHRFDSWFQSAEAFDRLKNAGMVTCSICGSSEVEKAVMAPRVRPSHKAAQAAAETPAEDAPAPALSEPASPAEQALAEIKKKIEENSEYVGGNFASEARAMHEGEAPERAIYGEAKLDDAKKLIDDGVPVTPLPFLPGRKSN
ncbi:MAG: DUF1178 family protein [Thalassovita sp.]|nr:DUF1178 family protein [Thalassovita sp.]